MRTIIYVDNKTTEQEILQADFVIRIFGDVFVYIKNRNGTCAHIYSLKDLPNHITKNEGISIEKEAVNKFNAMWGAYGESGDEPPTFKRLIDLETSHLQSILNTQYIGTEYVNFIKEILQDRNEKWPNE